MVRTYIRKTQRGRYGDEALSQALAALASGAGVRATSRQFGVPAKTLRRHRDQLVSSPGVIAMGNRPTVFSAAQEVELVQHIQLMERAFFGLTTVDVRKLAYELAIRLGIVNHKWNPGTRMAGRDWLKSFMRRNSALSIRAPQGTSLSRAVGFNRPQVRKFFDVYKEGLDANHVDAMRVWNVDETGVTNVHKPVKIVATKGARSIGKVTSGERGKTVTVICAMNASGTFVPPLFVFPRKRMLDVLMRGGPTGSIGKASKSGWTDGTIFVEWLRHFVDVVKCTRDSPHILLLDGH